MNLAWKNFWQHPLSTIMGFLSFIFGTYTVMMTDPDFALLRNYLSPRIAGKLALASLVIKLYLRMKQKDPGREEVKVLDIDTGTIKDKMVNTYETPTPPKTLIK